MKAILLLLGFLLIANVAEAGTRIKAVKVERNGSGDIVRIKGVKVSVDNVTAPGTTQYVVMFYPVIYAYRL